MGLTIIATFSTLYSAPKLATYVHNPLDGKFFFIRNPEISIWLPETDISS